MAEIVLGIGNLERRLFNAWTEIESIFEIFQFLGTPVRPHFLMDLPFYNCKFPKFKGNFNKIFRGVDQGIQNLLKR